MVFRVALARLHSGHHRQRHRLHHLHRRVLHAAAGCALTFRMLEIAVGPRAIYAKLALDIRVDVDALRASCAGGKVLTCLGRVDERTVGVVTVGPEAALDLTALRGARLSIARPGTCRAVDACVLSAAEASRTPVPRRVGRSIIVEVVSLTVQFQTALSLQIILLVLDSLAFPVVRPHVLGLFVRLVDDEVVLNILSSLHVGPLLDI